MNIFKAISITLVLFGISLTSTSTPNAHFSFFEYKGNDAVFNTKINNKKEYFNPVLAGYFPDPSICRKGNDFYLVNSSFAFFPCIPLFHSTDLVHWTLIGHVISDPKTIQFDGKELSQGIFAPAISYNEKNDTFYVICTDVHGIGNFVCKTQNPSKGWSIPIPLPQVHGIDPSLYFEENGEAYIVHNDAPQGEPEYSGHRAIWLHRFDSKTDKTFGQKVMLVDGGVVRSQNPIWIEGPHLYKVNGRYFLMAAEGGTNVNHREVVFWSDKVDGPYLPCPINPILSQHNLPEERINKISSVGHADLIDTPNGEWYAVFLGCRPYKKNLYQTGRETFLLPVSWKDGQPVILEHGKEVPSVVRKAGLKTSPTPLTGNFRFREEFQSSLDGYWSFLRNGNNSWYKIEKENLLISPLKTSVYDREMSSIILRRQQHINFEASTEVRFEPQQDNQVAGISCFQNELNNLVLAKCLINNEPCVALWHCEKGVVQLLESVRLFDNKIPVTLTVIGEGGKYNFYMHIKGKQTLVKGQVDATHLSTEKAGGFIGSHIGLYASSFHSLAK